MKKCATLFLLAAGLLAGLTCNGCADTAPAGQQTSPASETALSETTSLGLSDETMTTAANSEPMTETASPPVPAEEKAGDTTVTQGGPYGEISLSIPDGWNYETFPMDNGLLAVGLYGLRFYPKDASKGYIELAYADWFGVCGTGLAEEHVTIAGCPVAIGTYDNNTYWDFISFEENYKGIVALTYDVEGWWETYSGQVLDILDTLSFNAAIKEGGAFQYNAESECDNIALSFTLKNITPTGATLVFHCYDADAPTGELEYGDDFILEIQKDDIWEEVPVALEGNYAFHQVAYRIPSEDSAEQELDWSWLYGTLAPGTYRIKKSILDFRGSGDYDKYIVYAQFILNES